MEYYLTDISTGAHIKSGTRKGRTDSSKEDPSFPPDLSHKGMQWVPVRRESMPAFDEDTQKCVQESGVVDGEYVFGWRVIDLTQEQIDARAVQQAEREAAEAAEQQERDTAERNRIRALLKAKIDQIDGRLDAIEARLDLLETP